MPRSTRNFTRLSADSSATRFKAGNPRLIAGSEEALFHPEDYHTKKNKKIKALVLKLLERDSHIPPDLNSTAVFPYFLEPDKIVALPFSEHANQNFAKTAAMYAPNHFNPEYEPEDNWPGFLNNLWNHLQHYL